MKVAQILNGRVHWIFEMSETMDGLRGRFAPDMVFAEVADDAEEGWDWDGEKAVKPIEPQPTTDELKRMFTLVVQEHLDKTVQARGYDNIVSCCSYVASSDPVFAAEAQAAVVWRDKVWRYCYTQLDLILSGQRELPGIADFITELEAINW